jgi:hypothetical protein
MLDVLLDVLLDGGALVGVALAAPSRWVPRGKGGCFTRPV